MKLQSITTIQDGSEVNSFCLLRDGRLVSGSEVRVVIYNEYTYESDIIIKDDTDVYSVCALKNGNLASSSNYYKVINIYEITEDNYHLIHTIKGHSGWINKIIELKDSKLASCSDDATVRIWDNNYQCIQILKGHNSVVKSIIEISKYLISASNNSVIIWNKSTYESIKEFQGIYCNSNNGLSKVTENIVILRGYSKVFTLDILFFQFKSFQDKQLGDIWCICALRDNKPLMGNHKGKIIYFDSLTNQIISNLIISTQGLHNDWISCIIKNEDNQLFSSHFGKVHIIILFDDF